MFGRLFIKCSPQLFHFGLGAVGAFSFGRQLRLQVSDLLARRPYKSFRHLADSGQKYVCPVVLTGCARLRPLAMTVREIMRLRRFSVLSAGYDRSRPLATVRLSVGRSWL